MRYAAQAQAMSEELRAVNADLLATRELLAESARDNERLRLSRELHDIAGHKLTALKINLAALAREARDDDERVRLCARLADELLAEIRGVIEQMRTDDGIRSEEHTSELQSLMRIPYAVFRWKKKTEQ